MPKQNKLEGMTTSKRRAFDFEAELKALPPQSGVYRMYNAAEELLYVGKAKNLRSRVRHYFQKGGGHTAKTRRMIPEIAYFDVIVTDSEVEALILEDNFIKEYQPPYNVLLKDDKRYPWLALTDEAFPRLLVTRRPQRQGRKTRYFGPYTSASELYRLLKVLRKQFPLRQRKNPLFKDRPCMNYHLGLCSGPCQQLINKTDYDEIVEQLSLFLKGKPQELIVKLTRQMEEASERLAFEEAAKLRDRLKSVDQLSHRHKIVSEDTSLSQDVIQVVEDGWMAALCVLSIRGGKIINTQTEEILLRNEETAKEVLEAFLMPYYRQIEAHQLPADLLLPFEIDDADILEAWLTEQRASKRRVKLLTPKRGSNADLLAMAKTNAERSLEQAKLYEQTKAHRDPIQAVLDLQERLDLPNYPERMECYDISHFQGGQTVASMVVFKDGEPDSASYRRFKIQRAEGKPDDFDSIREVMERRAKHRDDWGEPDLIIIDGGKGQLSSAYDTLQELGWHNQPIISLAKRYEEVFFPNRSQPVLIPHDTPALQTLQQIRDEAHRFAITYHRKLRSKKTFSTPIDDVEGLGKVSKKKLLHHFKTWQAIVEAGPDELAEVLGASPARGVKLFEAIQAKAHEQAESTVN